MGEVCTGVAGDWVVEVAVVVYLQKEEILKYKSNKPFINHHAKLHSDIQGVTNQMSYRLDLPKYVGGQPF